MSRRALVIALLLMAAVIAWLALRPQFVQLPLRNFSSDAATLEFYGAGLRQSATVTVAPQAAAVLRLALRTHGELRVRVITPRVRDDALLLPDVAGLRQAPQHFEIRQGGAFVLVAD